VGTRSEYLKCDSFYFCSFQVIVTDTHEHRVEKMCTYINVVQVYIVS